MRILSRPSRNLFDQKQSIPKNNLHKIRTGLITVLSLLFISAALGLNTQAQTPETQFFQGFETDSSNWFSPAPTRTASGAITASTGGFYGDIGNTNTFTRWGGYTTTFPTRGFITSIDMYLDLSGGYANDTRLDYTSAANRQNNTHLQDYIFSVGFYSDAGPFGSGNRFVMSASNNSPGNPRDVGRSPYVITTTGWYTFQHRFYDNGSGILAVDMSVIDSGGTVLNTWTLSTPANDIATTVGGNRYGWFPANGFPSIAIDNTQRANLISIRNVDDDGMASATDCDATDAAFTTIQSAIDDTGTLPGDLINVCPGTYIEDVNVNKAGLRVIGAGSATTTISGAIGGDGATVRISSSNVTVANFTLTRQGNNTTDWNNAGLNFAGVAVQGQAITNMLIRDNIIVGNRTGIDVNNSNGHTIRNNNIDNNRTGLLFRNQTDNITFVENFVTNSWTMGILFLDASGGTNTPLQQALGSKFNNNDISSNWYGQVVERQTGGSLPAPGTTNLKDFRYNWYGTANPVISTADSTEPGYAAHIPVIYGGTATAPGGQPDLLGPASANIFYTPLLTSGTDTDVETVAGRGTNGFQGATSIITVKPSKLNGWFFYNDETDVIDNSLGSFVPGPGTPPMGVGSSQISVIGNQKRNLATYQFAGTPLASLNELKYSTYNPSASNGGGATRAGYLQFNVDFDGSDTWQNRLLFVPRNNGTVVQDTWQEWDTIDGGTALWGYSKNATWPVGIGGGGEPSGTTAGAILKTWDQILSQYPGVRIRVSDPWLGIRVGEPYTNGYTENIDLFKFETTMGSANFDFEPERPSVTINQAAGQADPTSTSPINFTVVFSEAVTGFDDADVSLSGTAGATTAVVTGSGTTYNVAVSGMTGSGTIIAEVVDSAALGSGSTPSEASTSTDNSVTYFTCNEVSIATGQTVKRNTQFLVPVTIDDTTGRSIISYDFTVTFNPSVVAFIGAEKVGTLSNGLTITTNTSSGTIIISGFGTTPIVGAGTLLNLRFIATGGITTTSPLNFSSFTLNGGTPCATTTNGDVTVEAGTIAGQVRYVNSSTPPVAVPDVNMNAVGSVNVSDMTDSSGNYLLSGFGTGAYTVTPSKASVDPFTNPNTSITSFDAARIAQHVVGFITLNANQLIAADVTGDNVVSSFDAARIAQSVVGIANPSSTGSWVFVPATRSYPNVETDYTGQDYDAILKGEVSGEWMPPPPLSLLRETRRDSSTKDDKESGVGVVNVTAPTKTANASMDFVIPIEVDDTSGEGIISVDARLTYDPAVILPQVNACSVTGTISSGALPTCNTATPGLVIISLFTATPLNSAGVLVNLNFTAIGAAGTMSPLTFTTFTFNGGVPNDVTNNGRIDIVGPTAAGVSIGGKILSARGRGISNAFVTLTDVSGATRMVRVNNFGYYRFENVEVGQTYTATVASKSYTFTPQAISVADSVNDFDLIADPQ